MLDILNVLVAGVQLLSNIALTFDFDYVVPSELDRVAQVSMHREWWREDGNGKCQYQGFIVPYARDWEEVKANGDTQDETLPPKPNVIAGQAILITAKVCNGKETEQVLRAATYSRTSGKIYAGIIVHADDLTEATKVEQLPKWLPQVLARIDKAAQTDPQTKTLLEQDASLLSKVSALYSQKNMAPAEAE